VSKKGEPVKRSAETKAVAKRAESAALEQANAQRLAQIVNLMIAGHSLADIALSIGGTVEEVERLLTTDVQRYVRTQPALRVFVRNWISAKYTGLLNATYAQATDPNHPRQLDYQDRSLRVLKEMARLHGAEMPTQSEVKVDAAPEAVEKMVAALAAAQGVGYDASVFDVVDAEVVEDAVEESEAALLDASERVGEGDDEPV
jgi:hypothetical protein